LKIIDYIKGHRDELSPTEEVKDSVLDRFGVRLLIKRDDLIHQHISGNKWRKLRYNLQDALRADHHTVLTFGGAFSNHIAATAHACFRVGLDSIGVIRGEDDKENPTLKFARQQGMELHFVSRSQYRQMTVGAYGNTPSHDNRKTSLDGVDRAYFHTPLQEKFGRFFMIPEGGANAVGVKGCAEILPEVDVDFDVVCCAAGTGTTLAGLALTLKKGQQLIGFPALKGGGFLNNEVTRLIGESRIKAVGDDAEKGVFPYAPTIITDYHFGGYAKMKPELFDFIKGFQQRTGIPLDPVYTGKMMFGIYDMIRTGKIKKGTTILAIHTGGLQGWDGMKHRNVTP